MDKRTYPLELVCPCGSGKKYRSCCSRKDFKYVIDDDGHVVKTIKMTPELNKILEESRERFIEVFGREPGENDPLFIFSLIASEEDYLELFEEGAQAVGLRPEIVYAHRKTGLLVTRENMELLSDLEIKEWDDAIKEYYTNQKRKKKITPLEDLFIEAEKLVYLYGLFIHKQNEKFHNESYEVNYNEDQQLFLSFIMFCITRHVKTFQSTLILLDKGRGEDAMNLTRSMYENYLNILCIGQCSSKYIPIIQARIGLFLGTHTYSPKRREIIEIETGKKIQKSISGYAMAEMSPHIEDVEIYEYLYDFLSKFTHPDMVSIAYYIDPQEGFSHLKRHLLNETFVIAVFVNALVLDRVRYLDFIDPISQNDILVFLKKIKPKLLKALRYMNKHGRIDKRFSVSVNRIKSIDTKKDWKKRNHKIDS